MPPSLLYILARPLGFGLYVLLPTHPHLVIYSYPHKYQQLVVERDQCFGAYPPACHQPLALESGRLVNY